MKYFLKYLCLKIDSFLMLSSYLPIGYREDFRILAKDSFPLVSVLIYHFSFYLSYLIKSQYISGL